MPPTPGAPVATWACAGCGRRVPADEPWPFRCPAAVVGDDVDHALRRRLDAGSVDPAAARARFVDREPNPLVRYGPLLAVASTAAGRRLGSEQLGALARGLDERIARIEGKPVAATPYLPVPELARRLGVAELWVKDETGQPAGSHKIRHLSGAMLWIEALEAAGERLDGPLAIASCGNAALAAAVVAAAARRELLVYVPETAPGRVIDRLAELGAETVACRRRQGEAGDPAYREFERAVAEGAVPFSVQGPDCAISIDGGYTLGWEIVSEILAGATPPGRLLVQVGGGALLTAVSGALREAVELGLLDRVPRLHAVQTEAVAPLARAWERFLSDLFERRSAELGRDASPADPEAAADLVVDRLSPATIEREVSAAARRRSRYMRPWPRPGASLADAILDDETYDWLEVVRGMALSGGYPVTVGEDLIAEGWAAARTAAEAVGPTGAAGLAGALELARRGTLGPTERVAVLLTGVTRGPRGLEAAAARNG